MGSLAVVQAKAYDATGMGRKPAIRQYDSKFFNDKWELARYDHDEWYVVTPDHGLIEPTEEVEPDTELFAEFEPSEQARWSLDVVSDVAAEVRRHEYDPVVVYADLEMRNSMKDNASMESRLAAAGAKLIEPLAGLGPQDKQEKWLREQLEIRKAAGEEKNGEIKIC
jgi:hypothetical protein